MKFVEKCFQTTDKSLVKTLMSTLTIIKFDDSRTMHEHVIEMTNIAIRLKSLWMEVDKNFLVQFILNSLPSEYSPFQMNYNIMKDKQEWINCTVCWFKRRPALWIKETTPFIMWIVKELERKFIWNMERVKDH